LGGIEVGGLANVNAGILLLNVNFCEPESVIYLTHHEFFHYVDVIITGPQEFNNDKNWEKLNPSGFKYTGAGLKMIDTGANIHEFYPEKGFITRYAMSAVEEDKAEVFDIMVMPDNLTAYERNKKLIIIVKKEVNNMRRILEKLASVYPDLREKRILIVDDEADYASISFRKHAEAVEVGRISSQIDELRSIVQKVDYLQVTATPYSLYLQPSIVEDRVEFLPKRPAFTLLLPKHDEYVGGDFYFNESEDENSIAHFVFEEVSVEEREVLKEPDARRLKLEDVFSSTFLMKYSFINLV